MHLVLRRRMDNLNDMWLFREFQKPGRQGVESSFSSDLSSDQAGSIQAWFDWIMGSKADVLKPNTGNSSFLFFELG